GWKPKGTTTPIKRHRDKDGRYVVYYNLADQHKVDHSTEADEVTQLDDNKRATLKRVFQEIEQVAMLRFEEVPHAAPHTDIRILQGKIKDPKFTGYVYN